MVRKVKKSKYKKTYIETWRCKGCEFQWNYRTLKCPMCYNIQTIKII